MGNCCATHSNELDNSLTCQRGGSSSGVKRVSDKSQHHSSLLTPKDQANFQKKIIKSPPSPRSEGDILSSPHLKKFTLSDLKNATRNFRSDNLLGEGGFGDVYKGWMDEQTLVPARPGQGMPVAVKKLKADGLQGHKEWLSEVNYLGQLHHHNLVKLIGYCLEGENRLLVYEFMPKGSLENHLFKSGAQPLSWVIRIKVAIEAARGLSFLHDSDQQIIYRDFKASNILLDSDFNAKLSDFGLAKAGPTGDRTHVSTQVLGTQGYAAPEYIATGRLTAKCDVYSFGVVLLELLTGRRALDKTKVGLEQNLVDWAKPYLGDRRKLFRIMDTNLQGQYPQREAFMVALLASQCISEAKLRPRMAEVLAILEELPGTKYGTSPSLSDLNNLSSPFSWSPLRYNAYSSYVYPRESPLPSPSQMNSPSNMDPRESPLLKRMQSSKGMDPKGSPMPTYVNLPRSMGSTLSPLPTYRYEPQRISVAIPYELPAS